MGTVTIASLKKQVSGFPRMPGVYLMYDGKGEVIYVGKAKDLRSRVRSYFAGGDGRRQIEFLLAKTVRIEKMVTGSEEQAFILERDLINKFKPRYNIRLKDDKSYLSIRIDENQDWPKLELVRHVEQDGARYFGPYSFSYELREMLDIINRAIPLRSCADTVFYNRQRPCLEHQIKRCLGPCALPVERGQYAELVKQAIAVLSGHTAGLIEELESKMKRASQELRFEDAAALRDRIEILKNFKKGQKYISAGAEDRDVFALHRQEELAALSILKVRRGRMADTSNYSFSGVQIPDGEILASALAQYYRGEREIPAEIILPCVLEDMEMIGSWLGERAGGAVTLCVPKRGLKFRLLKLAELNAGQHFVSVFDSERRAIELGKALAKLLKLNQIPRRIECVDISNLQGSDIVGALAAFYDGAPDKKSYKRYKISRQGKADDFAAVHEVVMRRLRRGMEENTLPDLMIIDGGAGQLAAALSAREELKAGIEIAALAKHRPSREARGQKAEAKPERIYMEGRQDPVLLEPDSEVTKYLARIRDEAHRFVIGFHRRTRGKRAYASVLDEISGLGPERKRRLLKTFGSTARIRSAAVEEIAKAGRMPSSLARKVLEKLTQH